MISLGAGGSEFIHHKAILSMCFISIHISKEKDILR